MNNSLNRKSNTNNPMTIGIIDIDKTIIDHINDYIKPTINHNNEPVLVKTIYGNPERWKSIQKDGYLRDKSGKILYPIIIIKRNNISKNRNISRKLDARNPHLFQYFPVRYTKKNKYSRFNALLNRKPINEWKKTVVPDYVILKYSGIIFTNFAFQTNKIIEALEYNSDSYWGDNKQFLFKTKIDSFSTSTEINIDSDRIIKTSFELEVNGYLLSDTLTKDNSYNDIELSKGQIIWDEEIITNI